ncbi:MAG: cytosine permease [Dehalogenimonas sp.]
MNGYPTEYKEYQPMFWQSAFSAIIGMAMMVALGAWALSTVRKALKGEDVEFPL